MGTLVTMRAMAGLAEEAFTRRRKENASTARLACRALTMGLRPSSMTLPFTEARWRRRNATYHRLVSRIYRSLVPPGRRVLEIGCGPGDLLAEIFPRRRVWASIFSARMVELATTRYPNLHFRQQAGEEGQRSRVRSTTSCCLTSCRTCTISWLCSRTSPCIRTDGRGSSSTRTTRPGGHCLGLPSGSGSSRESRFRTGFRPATSRTCSSSPALK